MQLSKQLLQLFLEQNSLPLAEQNFGQVGGSCGSSHVHSFTHCFGWLGADLLDQVQRDLQGLQDLLRQSRAVGLHSQEPAGAQQAVCSIP